MKETISNKSTGSSLFLFLLLKQILSNFLLFGNISLAIELKSLGFIHDISHEELENVKSLEKGTEVERVENGKE